jgi:hypothetical protein
MTLLLFTINIYNSRQIPNSITKDLNNKALKEICVRIMEPRS